MDSTTIDELESAADRFADALRRAPDLAARAGTLEWSVHQLGAHLATGAEEYVAMVRGDATGLTDLARRAEVGAANIAREAGTPVDDLARRIQAGTAELAVSLRKLGPAEPVPFYAWELPAAVVGSLFLAELLVHGHDLARLPMPAAAAGQAGLDAATLLPHVVRPGAPERARLALRARGVGEVVVTVDGDSARVGAPGGPVDARLSAEPATFLLACYGRVSPGRAMLRGRLSVTGRRPWRLKALQTRFDPP